MAIKSIIRVTQGCQPWVLISWHLTSFPVSLFKLAPRLRHCFSMSAKLPVCLLCSVYPSLAEELWFSRSAVLFGVSATQIALHLLPQMGRDLWMLLWKRILLLLCKLILLLTC